MGVGLSFAAVGVYSRLLESRSAERLSAPEEPVSAPRNNGPGKQIGSIVANVGDRIQEILDLAEQVAGEIRADAEAAGRTYFEDRRREADRIVEERKAELDAITEVLVARAANVEREATAFAAEVEQVRWRLARLTGNDPVPAEPRPSDGWPSRAAWQPPGLTGRGTTQAAALRATQMAVAGAERSEIENMLRNQFGIEDDAAIEGILRTGRL